MEPVSRFTTKKVYLGEKEVAEICKGPALIWDDTISKLPICTITVEQDISRIDFWVDKLAASDLVFKVGYEYLSGNGEWIVQYSTVKLKKGDWSTRYDTYGADCRNPFYAGGFSPQYDSTYLYELIY